MRQFLRPALLLSVVALSSAFCKVDVDVGRLRSPIVCDDCNEECPVCMESLGEHGDSYTKRGGFLTDIGEFQPEPNESYRDYQARMFQTMAYQQQKIAQLEAGIAQHGDSLSELEGQEEQLRALHADLRLQLSQQEMLAQRHKNNSFFSAYKVRKGDTLCAIAQDRYGTKLAWLSIYQFNRDALPNGPNVIEVGQVLLLPSDVGPLPEA